MNGWRKGGKVERKGLKDSVRYKERRERDEEGRAEIGWDRN